MQTANWRPPRLPRKHVLHGIAPRIELLQNSDARDRSHQTHARTMAIATLVRASSKPALITVKVFVCALAVGLLAVAQAKPATPDDFSGVPTTSLLADRDPSGETGKILAQQRLRSRQLRACFRELLNCGSRRKASERLARASLLRVP